MSDANERVKELKDKLMSKEQALEKVVPFEGCTEVIVRGKTNFDYHPTVENQYIMSFTQHNQEKEYAMNEAVFTKLCRLVGIPATYLRRLTFENHNLMFPHLSYWLKDGDVGVKAFMKSLKDKEGRDFVAGFAHEDAYYYPISKILAQVDNVVDNYLVEGLEDVSWRNSTFGLVFPQYEFGVEEQDIQKGDYIYGGVKVRNSLLGEYPLKISAFLLTLACLNGMVSVDEIYTYNRKQGVEGEDQWLMDGVQNAIGALNSEVQKVQELTAIPIGHDDIPIYVAHVFDQRGINAKTREAVLSQIVGKNPQNLYQLMNAITATAHAIENRGEVYALQSLGGYVASHAASCAKCKRPF